MPSLTLSSVDREKFARAVAAFHLHHANTQRARPGSADYTRHLVIVRLGYILCLLYKALLKPPFGSSRWQRFTVTEQEDFVDRFVYLAHTTTWLDRNWATLEANITSFTNQVADALLAPELRAAFRAFLQRSRDSREDLLRVRFDDDRERELIRVLKTHAENEACVSGLMLITEDGHPLRDMLSAGEIGELLGAVWGPAVDEQIDNLAQIVDRILRDHRIRKEDLVRPYTLPNEMRMIAVGCAPVRREGRLSVAVLRRAM